LGFLIGAIKIIFVLGFLIFVHECGHFFMAKAFKIKVREFSLGFGPLIKCKNSKGTKYSLRAVPFGGYVDMVGETERKDEPGAFNKASILTRVAILAGGSLVNIILGIGIYFILAIIATDLTHAFTATGNFLVALIDSLRLLFTGNIQVDQMVGPIGISEIVVQSSGLFNFVYLFSVISISLGITNLLPFPALDGGRIILLVLEAIRRKPLSEKIEMTINSLGFTFLILLSIYISYNDVLRII